MIFTTSVSTWTKSASAFAPIKSTSTCARRSNRHGHALAGTECWTGAALGANRTSGVAMDFSLDEETKLFRDAYVQWVERDLLPLEEKEKITQDTAIDRDLVRKIRKQAVELGVWGHHMPEDV